MIDLSEARALAARARENTSDGLTALEALPDVVEQLAGEVESMRDPDEPPGEQWATRLRWPSDGSEEVMPSYGEPLARRRMANLPKMHLALLRRTVTFGPWVEVPAGKEANDA